MSWTSIKSAYNELATAVCGQDFGSKDLGSAKSAWEGFALLATLGPGHIPYHLQAHFQHLAELSRDRDASAIEILDHGCGGGLTLLYMLANGYRGIHGVDIGGDCGNWNRFLREVLSLEGERFHVYDGAQLPFDDASFHFIFSEEVVEHVRPNVLGDYYSEEKRVLRPGGIVFHRVPHRLTPYEGHTRTWFLHYLPRGLWLRALRGVGKDTTTAEAAIFLRWPWVHRRLVRVNLGNCQDRTLQRFVGHTNLADFEGPQGLRRCLGMILAVPVLGFLAGVVLKNLVMLDTVSRPDGTD